MRFFPNVKEGVVTIMSNREAAPSTGSLSRFEQLRYAREVIRIEGRALLQIAERLGHPFCDAIDCILGCSGSVIVTGMGKAGLIGQKIAATLASTGTVAHFLHPGEAIHGDLGRLQQHDVLLAFSFSGETEEVTRLLPCLSELNIPLIAVTGRATSRLAQAADVTLDLGPLEEACPLGLAPSTSTTAMLALGDALALVLSRTRQFGSADFARLHPGGSLGRKLAKVDEIMRPLSECRQALDSDLLRSVLIRASRPGRRSGAIMLTDPTGQLTGVFTDSDLARLLERQGQADLDRPIGETMTRTPKTVTSGSLLTAAISLLASSKISELPVVDHQGRPIGLIDITDVVSLIPAAASAAFNTTVTEEHDQHGEPASGEETPDTVPFTNPAVEQNRR